MRRGDKVRERGRKGQRKKRGKDQRVEETRTGKEKGETDEEMQKRREKIRQEEEEEEEEEESRPG